jgi:hypothetical protein
MVANCIVASNIPSDFEKVILSLFQQIKHRHFFPAIWYLFLEIKGVHDGKRTLNAVKN